MLAVLPAIEDTLIGMDRTISKEQVKKLCKRINLILKSHIHKWHNDKIQKVYACLRSIHFYM